MELPTLLVKITLTIVLLGLVRILYRACDALILKPRRLRSKLQKQGIQGPPPSFLFGNLLEMRKAVSQVPKPSQGEQGIVHNCSSFLFPSLEKWTQQYGIIFISYISWLIIIFVIGRGGSTGAIAPSKFYKIIFSYVY